MSEINVAPTPSHLPRGKVYNLVPKLIGRTTGHPNRVRREPRFVPFEPFKAAVTPLFSKRKTNKKRSTNVDLSLLAGQLAEHSRVELLNMPGLSLGAEREEKGSTNQWELMYKDMRKEKDYLEKQLKFQVQVNAELKSLLIAAVGEDLQTRVNVLTEDKLTLARALMDSSHHLVSHSEQIEYVAGRCEVWRSKFLASSLMVEELARWKATLLEKNKHLVSSNRDMLKTMAQMRDIQEETLKNLSFLVRDKSQIHLESANGIDLAKESLNISQQLALINHSIGVPGDLQLGKLDQLTTAEKNALEHLELTTEENNLRTDEPFKAIVNHAFPIREKERGQSKVEGAETAVKS